MNRKEFIRNVAWAMREKNIRKPVSSPRHVFHISDDEGNHKDFIVRQTDKQVIFTEDDIAAFVDTCLEVIIEALKRGECISFRGFGTIGLKYRKPRATKDFVTGEWIEIAPKYVPKFSFGSALRMCAKIYELSMKEKQGDLPLPDFDDEDIEGGEDDAD